MGKISKFTQAGLALRRWQLREAERHREPESFDRLSCDSMEMFGVKSVHLERRRSHQPLQGVSAVDIQPESEDRPHQAGHTSTKQKAMQVVSCGHGCL